MVTVTPAVWAEAVLMTTRAQTAAARTVRGRVRAPLGVRFKARLPFEWIPPQVWLMCLNLHFK
jgi:hypothetical protein